MRFRAHGASMQPNIVAGDALVVAPMAKSAVRRGEVVLTEDDCGLKAHRVVQQDSETGVVVTRGDSGQEDDAPSQSPLGRIVSVEHEGRSRSAVGVFARVAAKANSGAHHLQLAFWHRTAKVLHYFFPVALLLLLCLMVNVSPAAAANADLQVTETPATGTVSAGGNIAYTIVVKNNGASNAAVPQWTQATPTNTTFVSLTGTAGWTCTTPSVGVAGTVTCTDNTALASGSSKTFTLTVAVNAGVVGNTSIGSSVSVTSSTTTDATPGNNTATTTFTVVPADLSITQTPSPTTVNPGGAIAYTNVVTNNGASIANAPVFTQATPTNTTFQSVTATAGWTCTNPAVGGTGTITCTDGSNMANGATATFTVNVQVNAGVSDLTTISGSGTITSTSDTAAGNNSATSSVTVSAPADLSISQTASAPVVAAGANVIYTVVVTNNGANQSQNVVFYENIPANTTFQSIGTVPTGWTCTTPGVNGTTPINCSIASLANAGTATFTVTLQVTAGTAAETVIQNVTSVTSNTTNDPVASNNTSTTTLLVGITGDADLRLTLAASPNPVFVSSALAYTIAVQNLGVADATSTTITNTLPVGVSICFCHRQPGQLLAKRRRGDLQSRNTECRCHRDSDDQCYRARDFQLSERHGQHDVRGHGSFSLKQFRDAADLRAAAFVRYARA